MADEIRNRDSRVRVLRLLRHRDDAGAWEIGDFLKRSVVELQWVELSTEEDDRHELGLSDLKKVKLPVVELPDGTRLFGPRCGMLPTGLASSPSPSCGSTTSRSTVQVRTVCRRQCTP